MLDLLNEFVNNNVLYYGTLFALSIIFVSLICYLKWTRYKVKLIAEMKAKENVEVDTVDQEEKANDVEKVEHQEEEKTTAATLKIENLLDQMKEDLEAQKQEAIDHFENQQEENSIISYQELKKLAHERGLEIDDEEAPLLTTSELLNRRPEEAKIATSTSIKEEVKEALMRPKEPPHHREYKRTQFISPVYGLVDDRPHPMTPAPPKPHEEVPGGHEKRPPHEDMHKPKINVQALEEENRHLDEFLQSLKEFRNNL